MASGSAYIKSLLCFCLVWSDIASVLGIRFPNPKWSWSGRSLTWLVTEQIDGRQNAKISSLQDICRRCCSLFYTKLACGNEQQRRSSRSFMLLSRSCSGGHSYGLGCPVTWQWKLLVSLGSEPHTSTTNRDSRPRRRASIVRHSSHPASQILPIYIYIFSKIYSMTKTIKVLTLRISVYAGGSRKLHV